MSDQRNSASNTARAKVPKWLVPHLKQYGLLLFALALLLVVFGSRSNNFLTMSTLGSIANQIPDLTLIAVGMTFVLMIGAIDLSVGSVVALSSTVLGVLMIDWGWPWWAAATAGIAAGGICGLISGSIVVMARIPSFIVTLGMLEFARGLCYQLTDSQTKYLGNGIDWIGQPLASLSVSPAFLLAIAVVIAGQFLLTGTVLGRYCVAIGTNAETVRMSGIRTGPYCISVFMISGLLSGVAGIVVSSRLATADPNAAVGIELAAIAACVIGGTSLMGGRGSVISTLLGVLVIAVLQTGLAQMGASDPMKRMITGVVIILAVLLDAFRKRPT